MKKVLAVISLIFLLGTSAANASNYTFRTSSGAYTLGKAAGYDVSTETQPESYVGLILNVLFSLVGLLFLVLAISAGVKWMTAQGNTTQVETAKGTLTNAIIGLAVVLLAYAITIFVLNLFQNNKDDSGTTATSTSSYLRVEA
jgi:Na+/phosphate symporter